jgi:hypothetical protein
MHTSVYDNALHAPELPELLEEAGISLLRYPGGGYSDNYHWATHTMTHWADNPANKGYLGPDSDFGSYVSVLDAAGVEAMITVNYGSNQTSDGPGEPKEAAAWVAYANGDPEDDTVIGEDSTGHNWSTVGFWATLRASEPLEQDDGFNFLRIARPEPIDIEYWEVGNEVFGNGYYARGGDVGFEEDLHVPYDGTTRTGNSDLSPTTYGQGVVKFVDAMKSVDPDIKVGAVLVTPPMDNSWAPDWNPAVLTECGELVDFGIVHFYPGPDVQSLLTSPRTQIPSMFKQLHSDFEQLCGGNADNIEVTVTELGANMSVDTRSDLRVNGLFAADSYLTFLAYGATNVDWLELHKSSFLSERTQTRGPAFYAIALAHRMAPPGDTLVAVDSTSPGLRVHASRRSDNSIGVMLINMNAVLPASATVLIADEELDKEGERYDYVRTEEAEDGTLVGPSAVEVTDDELLVEVAPFSIALLLLPVAR